MAMTKVKNLQLWCKKMTDGYRDVDVKDMTTSWKDGLAFCALIHKFRPDLIDFDSLSKENVFDNNQLAFDVAERELNIPAFLDAPDMVAIKVPDRLSIVTYVSQYYNNLHDKPQLGGPGVKKAVATKRHQDKDTEGPEAKRLTPSHDNTKTPTKERGSMGDKCYICGEKVYLMERHVDKNKLYHRHCFRHSDLSPTSKVFNKSELKKIQDKVKSENEAKKHEKSEKNAQSQPDFWKRRNEARKVEKMDLDDSVLTKGPIDSDSKVSKHKDKHIKDRSPKRDKNVLKDSEHISAGKDKKMEKFNSKETAPVKKDRPLELNLETKTEKKKSHDPKPSPRKLKTDHAEPMDTSEISDIHLKPVPTPRTFKDTSPVNGFLSKTRGNLPNSSSPLNDPQQKMSSSSDKSPLSPPPLPSQPPPAQLLKSDLLSPQAETIKNDLGEKAKPSVTPERKSPQFNFKTELSSPRSSMSPDSGNSVFISPRNKFSPTAFESRTSSDSSKIGAITRDSKISPKSDKKFTTNNGLISHNEGAQRSSNFSPPLRKPSPLDQKQFSMEDAINLTKNSTNSNETVAVVVTPSSKQQEENDKQILGGLLSNLANIRKQKLSASSPNDDISDKKHSIGIVDNQSKDKRENIKSAVVTKPLSDSDQSKHKHSSDHESQKPQKGDSDIPEWKRQLEMNKKLRPKSGDMFSEKKDDKKVQRDKVASDEPKRPKTEVPARPKSDDLFSDKFKVEQKPQWQIEAEKRMEARKGGYVDPEKAKPNAEANKEFTTNKDISKPDRTSSPIKPNRVDITISDDKRESANVQKRVLPSVPSYLDKSEHKENVQDKKRISVNVKFDFGKEGLKEQKLKPPRPPPVSSGSPKSPHEKPARPPPPLKDGDVKRLSPSEIQKQLTEIDSRLTELEIRGRQLEDSIRKAQEEEDEKMMVEWFDLVNNKNELVRKEADLIYLSRAQELEEQQHDIDRKLRDLIQKDVNRKTEEEKKEEEYLIQKLLDVVNQRNVIVDSIDEDRIRYEEEDKDIAMALQALAHDSGHVTIQSTVHAEAKYSKKKKKKKGKLL